MTMNMHAPFVNVECWKVAIVQVTHKGKMMVTKVSFEGGEANRNMNSSIVTILNQVEGIISLFRLGKLNVEGMDQAKMDHFHLTIGVVVESSGVFKLET